MKVLFFTQSDEICAASRTRVYQYLPFLRSRGIACKVVPMATGLIYKGAFVLPESKIKKSFYIFFSLILNYIKSLQILALARYYDVIFIQRVLIPKVMARLLVKINDNIIFDFDDAIYAIESPRTTLINRLRVNRNKKYLPLMLSISKAAIVENEYNKKYAEQFLKNVYIITGPLDTQRYRPNDEDLPKESKGDIVIGWIGSPTTTVYLRSLKDVFMALSRKHKIILEFIGAASFEIPEVKMVKKRWHLNTEVSDLQGFDIGIMPLPDNDWTKGKGGFKLLQYLAMGIPAVTTPVGVNSEIVQNGINGYLVNSEEEWIERLSLLIEDSELRQRMGRAGRKRIEEKFSIAANVPGFIEILKNAQTRGG
ncbi:glycosyltransferase family 4 protein [Candidatus Omnitrophota bacterium]